MTPGLPCNAETQNAALYAAPSITTRMIKSTAYTQDSASTHATCVQPDSYSTKSVFKPFVLERIRYRICFTATWYSYLKMPFHPNTRLHDVFKMYLQVVL
ncbi:hypothetical protein LMG33818_001055 [Halomonadaceae bacterium LMG 33818]